MKDNNDYLVANIKVQLHVSLINSNKETMNGDSLEEEKSFIKTKFLHRLGLYRSFHEYFNNKYSSVILKEYFRNQIGEIRDKYPDAKIYFTSYSEKEGSLIFELLLTVVAATTTYPTIYQTIDSIFEKFSGKDRDLRVDVYFDENVVFGYKEPVKQGQLYPKYKRYIISAISLAIGLFFGYITAKSLLPEEPSNNEEKIRHIVKEEIEQAIRNQKLDYLFFDRYFTPKDTTNQSLSQ